MANSVYKINKGINKSIEFKGFKAQYIWYMVIVILCLLFVFALLYFLEINHYISLIVCVGGGFTAFHKVYAMSKKYGEHGLSKMIARKRIPNVLKSIDRSIFIKKDKSCRKEKNNGSDRI